MRLSSDRLTGIWRWWKRWRTTYCYCFCGWSSIIEPLPFTSWCCVPFFEISKNFIEPQQDKHIHKLFTITTRHLHNFSQTEGLQVLDNKRSRVLEFNLFLGSRCRRSTRNSTWSVHSLKNFFNYNWNYLKWDSLYVFTKRPVKSWRKIMSWLYLIYQSWPVWPTSPFFGQSIFLFLYFPKWWFVFSLFVFS